MSADQQSLSHTTGPWEVLRVGDTLAIMPDPITGRPDTFLGIAIIQEHDGERSPRRVEANAHLLAAAPELLEALKATTELLRGVNRSTDRPSDYVYRALAKADAAISKALGETQ